MTRLAHLSDIHITAPALEWRLGDWFTKRYPGWVNFRWLGRRRQRGAGAVRAAGAAAGAAGARPARAGDPLPGRPGQRPARAADARPARPDRPGGRGGARGRVPVAARPPPRRLPPARADP